MTKQEINTAIRHYKRMIKIQERMAEQKLQEYEDTIDNIKKIIPIFENAIRELESIKC